MSWVYWRSEPGLWTVGYYEPSGSRRPDSDHGNTDDAAERVHYLNGGEAAGDLEELRDRLDTVEATALTVLARLAALETAVFGHTDFPMSKEDVAAAIEADEDAGPPDPGCCPACGVRTGDGRPCKDCEEAAASGEGEPR